MGKEISARSGNDTPQAPPARTRTGCWTCRARRVKCDERRPTCKRCQRGNLSCSYGLRLIWEEDAAARGMCHGRSGVWSKTGSNGKDKKKRQAATKKRMTAVHQEGKESGDVLVVQQPRFLNTTVEDVRLYFGFEDKRTKRDSGYDVDQSYTRMEVDDEMQQEPEDLIPADEEIRWDDSTLEVMRPLSILPISTRSKFSGYDSILLSYYESVICSSSTLMDDQVNNPYRHVILPMAVQSSCLYHATLAISANHLRLGMPEYGVVALEHRGRALKGLRTILGSGQEEWDQVMALVLMLCWFEISDGCRPTWVMHLNGYRGLMFKRQQHEQHASSSHSQTLSQHLGNFFSRYFTYHLVMAKTAFAVEDVLQPPSTSSAPSTPSSTSDASSPSSLASVLSPQPTSTELLSLTMSLDTLDYIDPYTGFSNSLLLLINETADLARHPTPHDPASLDVLRATYSRIANSLVNLTQSPPPLPQTHPSAAIIEEEAQRRSALLATAEAHRLAALIFLHEACSPLFTSFDSTSSGSLGASVSSATLSNDHTTPSPNPLLPPATKAANTAAILRLVEYIATDFLTAAFPLWPLFIAGCCLDDASATPTARGAEPSVPNPTDDDAEHDYPAEVPTRMQVLRIFEAAEARKRFGNIAPAREVVEMVWRQRDLGSDEMREGGDAAGIKAKGRGKSKGRGRAAKNKGERLDEDERTLDQTKGERRFEWEKAMAMMGGWKVSLT